MKNKRGFTLIELLAIIVILAVIAVITTPIILNIIENSKKGAAQDSALGYKDAIHKYYASRLSLDSSFMMADHIYEIVENGYLSYTDSNDSSNNVLYEILLDGKVPNGGFVEIERNIVKNACIGFDDYSVLISDGSVSDVLKGECISVDEIGEADSSQLAINTEYLFPYVSEGDDKEQTLVVPATGYYKLEVWGASGGDAGAYSGGYGSYSSGVVKLNKGQTLYVNVGGQGCSSANASICGGYNGGGTAITASSNDVAGGGGGATHIALKSGVLSSFDTNNNGLADSNEVSSLLIVAGGGGGAYNATAGFWSDGGSGGGAFGGVVTNGGCLSRTLINGAAASQTSGGTPSSCGTSGFSGTFGQGGSNNDWSSGGGGGFYGGGTGYAHGANGGSGYIGNSNLLNGIMYCYDCLENGFLFNRTISTTGNNRDTINCPNNYDVNSLTNCAKDGNGYAKITYLGKNPLIENTNNVFNYDFLQSSEDIYNSFIASETGYYKFEAWGAQGGDTVSGSGASGGHGGYTSGILYLNKNASLYVYVGGKNGYNGGGNKGYDDSPGTNGGGSTDIRILPSSNINSLASRIMVAGGGGGAYSYGYSNNYRHNGGSGGGLTGNSGTYYNTCQSTGGTQISGGVCDSNTAVFGSFGVGGNGAYWGSGGGGGYFGGSGRFDMSDSGSGAGGGSSYVSGYTGCIAIAGENSITARSAHNVLCEPGTTDPECSYHYSGNIFLSPVIIDGSSSMPSKNGGENVIGNSGNGKVKITYLGESLN